MNVPIRLVRDPMLVGVAAFARTAQQAVYMKLFETFLPFRFYGLVDLSCFCLFDVSL